MTDSWNNASPEAQELASEYYEIDLAEMLVTAKHDLTRVTGLYEQWVKAGPPLGVPIAHWWDARLVELHNAIQPAAEQPARTTAINPDGTDRTPSQRPGLRDQLADATVPLLLDTLPKVIARARGYEVADAVLTLLCHEWPWLRAEAEDRDQLRATLAAITDEAARRGVISIDGIRNIVKEQQS